MAVYLDREHFIPLAVDELVEFLAAGTGAKTDPAPLPASEATAFRKFADLLAAHYHREFLDRMRGLKAAYAAFDPDSDTPPLVPVLADAQAAALARLYGEVRNLLVKANYKELPRLQAMQAMQGHSFWGLEMDVAWEVFEHIEIYYRGDTVGIRTLRRWWKLWRKEEKVVPEFNRLVLVLKQQPHQRLGRNADTKSVYLKMFKDMPKTDLEMVLPGTRVKLSRYDKGMIVYPLASGLAVILYKILADVIGFTDVLSLTVSVSLSWSLAAAFAGYGYKSYLSYTNKKTAYTLRLTQSLYYQNIDSNAGVFFRLVDEAEDQESREALLAYYWLWQRAGGRPMTAAALDDAIEQDLERRLGIKVDFEIGDALDKLERLNIVRKEGDGYAAVPMDRALAAVAGGYPAKVGSS